MADYVVDRVVLERTEVGKAVRKLAISGLHGHLLHYVSYTILFYIILFILYYTVLYYTILYTILLDIRCVAFSASEALRGFVFWQLWAAMARPCQNVRAAKESAGSRDRCPSTTAGK